MKKDAKDHARNRLMDCYIKKAPTYAAIVKIEHFENDDASSKDFEPFVVYSLNKKKRWEINEESLNSSTEGTSTKSVIIDREIPDLQDSWCK